MYISIYLILVSLMCLSLAQRTCMYVKPLFLIEIGGLLFGTNIANMMLHSNNIRDPRVIRATSIFKSSVVTNLSHRVIETSSKFSYIGGDLRRNFTKK